jgi:hypothetical protein
MRFAKGCGSRARNIALASPIRKLAERFKARFISLVGRNKRETDNPARPLCPAEDLVGRDPSLKLLIEHMAFTAT